MNDPLLPRIALVQGDATGIGPELTAKLLALDDVRAAARTLVISDPNVFESGCAIAQVHHDIAHVTHLDDVDWQRPLSLLPLVSPDLATIPLGAVSRAAGKAVLAGYGLALDGCHAGQLDGLCFMPFNKDAMHQAGLDTEDETQWAKQRIGHRGRVSEFNVIDGMWNARVTSHVPLKDVSGLLSIARIVESIVLADRTLRAAGFERPRIAVAALNPHAGDGGAIGREEIDIIQPAVDSARAQQIVCDGPFPSDTLYLKVRDGHYDCAVSMYHDQGQIAIKLLGFHMGVSVHCGLPFPIATPAHGTAFDIAGRNQANVEPARRAFLTVANMARSKLEANNGSR